MFNSKVPDESIKSEHLELSKKPLKIASQSSFPYTNLPSSRDFERLLYCLYAHPKTKSEPACFYDEAILMQGVGERGRDIWLKKDSRSVGLVQCKKYQKGLGKSELGKELVKFVLYSIQDNNLLDAKLSSFEYHIAVSSSITEPARNFISNFNAGIYEETEVKQWVESVTRNYKSLSAFLYEDQKGFIFSRLKKICIKPISPEFIDQKLSNSQYKDILKLFFTISSVVDVDAFEEVLTRREQTEIDLSASLTSVESRLRKLNQPLFKSLINIKKSTQNLHNSYPGNCLSYSAHVKGHQNDLIKIASETIVSEELLKKMNKHELFILAVSCYLTDVGICQNDEAFSELLDLGRLRPHESLQLEVQKRHHELTREFILQRHASLAIPEEYVEPISSIASVSVLTLGEIAEPSVYSWDLRVDKYSREKVCMPLLALIVLLSDLVDIEHSKSEILFKNYVDFPKFIEAKSLWEESKEIVSFIPPSGNEKRLAFEGRLDNQIHFLGVSERLEVIRKVISKTDEILRKASINKRIDIQFVDDSCITSPFKEGFGFSLDFENILSNFLGKKIYENEEVGIREIIQNSIDACLLRATSEESYHPDVSVELRDNERTLIVKDNGIGMDFYILKEYFAKLGRSYYVENNIANSIGQFGIGVYAYFMLSDRFVVRTKAHKSKAVKVTISRDSPRGFYFHDDRNEEVGTTVEISVATTSINLDSLHTYINKTFKHSPVPISLNDRKVVNGSDFRIDKETIINDTIKLPYRQDFYGYEYLSIVHETEFAKGTIGLFVPPIDREIPDLRRTGAGLKVFQNGVYVTNMLHFSGEINLKRTLPLKVNRNQFEDTQQVSSIIREFETALLKKISYSNAIAKEYQYNFTNFYLFNYANTGHIYERYPDVALDLFVVLCYVENKPSFLTLRQVTEIGKLAIHFISKPGDIVPSQELSELGIPLVSLASIVNARYIYNFIKLSHTRLEILNLDRCSVVVATPEGKAVKTKAQFKDISIVPFRDNMLCTVVPILSGSVFLNIKHPFIEYVEYSIETGKADLDFIQSVNQFVQELHSILFNNYPPINSALSNQKIELWKLNPFIDKINYEHKKSFKLTISDFPRWMHKRIVVEK